jgi:hypothetical protein
VAIVLAGAAVGFALLNTRPGGFGLLAVVCFGLSFLSASFPFITAGNESMTTYYFDQRWMAAYLGSRLNSMDLTRVTVISKRGSSWRFSRAWGFSCWVPGWIVENEGVRALITPGILEAESDHSIRMTREIRELLGLDPAAGRRPEAHDPIPPLSRPPYFSFPGIRSGRLPWPLPAVSVRVRSSRDQGADHPSHQGE